MKILFLSSLYPPHNRGGGELSAHYLARSLNERGHEVTVVTQRDLDFTGENGVVNYEHEGVKVRRLSISMTDKPLLEKSYARRLARIVQHEVEGIDKFDIVHAHDLRSIQALAEIIQVKRIITVRDYAGICGSPNNRLADGRRCPGCNKLKAVMRNQAVVSASLLRKPFRIWQYRYNIGYRQAAYHSIKHHVYLSQAQLDEVKMTDPLEGIHTQIIYNSLPPEYFEGAMAKSLNRTILFVGTVQEYKGVGLLLEAFRVLANKYPEVHLQIVGEGVERKRYERLVGQWGLQYRVKFIGRVAYERLRSIYDETAIFVAPHIWTEPFGRTCAEAMARGRIVIASNSGGPGEIIDDGKTGFLFERGSKEALVKVLERALQMRRIDEREMGQSARTWAKKNFSLDTIAEQYENAYIRLIG